MLDAQRTPLSPGRRKARVWPLTVVLNQQHLAQKLGTCRTRAYCPHEICVRIRQKELVSPAEGTWNANQKAEAESSVMAQELSTSLTCPGFLQVQWPSPLFVALR